MSDRLFDEEIALRRFQVALKRADWRMFEQALERLDADIAERAPFSRHQAWQDFARQANERTDLADALKERLRDVLGRLLEVKTRVSDGAAPAAAADAADAIALVVGWQGGFDDPRVLGAFRAWLGAPAPSGTPEARRMLAGWLAEGLGLGAIARRAALSLAATAAGVTVSDAPWVATFYAGLARALAAVETPPLTRLGEALAGVGTASLIVTEPGDVWERSYAGSAVALRTDGAGSGVELVKLAGSLDCFACPACHEVTNVPPGVARVLTVACGACGTPAWPMLLPLDEPAYRPPACQAAWGRAAKRLAGAGTWVLVDPPAPGGDRLAEWLVGRLSPGKRVLVVSSRGPEVLEAWQAFLAPHAPSAVVTSRGPADEVLAFLLQGGVPELEPTADRPATFSPKKKGRR